MQNFSSLYNNILNFVCGNSFILTYYAQYFTQSLIFCSKLSCIASYSKVTSYTLGGIPQLCIHIMDYYGYTDHELVIELYAVSKGQS